MRTALLLLFALAMPTAVRAQAPEAPPGDPLAKKPIGAFAFDVRGAFPKLPQHESVATSIGVSIGNLPTRAIGLLLGANVYLLKSRSIAMGIGGEVLISGRGRTQEPTTEGGEPGPTVHARFSSVSPQVSLNFGHRDGWSYLSGGFGWGSYTAEREDAPISDPAQRATSYNYGGGARWFANKHIAISLDLRFYRLGATDASGTRPATPRIKSTTMSAGIAIR